MGELKIGRTVLGMVRTNCYFVYDAEVKKALVIDPAFDGAGIYEKLAKNGISVAAILLTHGHFDHIMGVNELKEKAGVKVYAAKAEQPLCESAELNCSDQVRRPYTVKADVYLSDKEVCTIEGMTFEMIETPGHTAGSCCFYFEKEKLLVCGDTLFQGSVGRTDLPTGSGGQLNRSIKEKLMVLPDDVKVYPGHGDSTTIGEERKYNPFCS